MLMASRMLHVKKGSQQTRNEAARIFHDNGNDFWGLMVIGDGRDRLGVYDSDFGV